MQLEKIQQHGMFQHKVIALYLHGILKIQMEHLKFMWVAIMRYLVTPIQVTCLEVSDYQKIVHQQKLLRISIC